MQHKRVERAAKRGPFWERRQPREREKAVRGEENKKERVKYCCL